MKKQNLIKWPNSTKTFVIFLILILMVAMLCQLAETKERNEKIHKELEILVDSLITSGSSADAAYQKAIEKVSFDYDLNEKEETQLVNYPPTQSDGVGFKSE